MARVSRAEVFSPQEIAIVHVMNRVVRRCFLMGVDVLTGKDYSHRKQWIEDQIERLAAYFGIDVLCYAVMSNHFHQVLRSRPDVVQKWNRREVARRWLMLCPKRKRKDGSACEPREAEIRSIADNDIKFEEIRTRLSDISWWMRLLCQRIAQRCNAEDQMKGRFWESRFRAVRLLDEEAILACAAYVDLNPIRAAIAEDLEHSNHTSIQSRLKDLRSEVAASESEMQSEGSLAVMLPNDTIADKAEPMEHENPKGSVSANALVSDGSGARSVSIRSSARRSRLSHDFPASGFLAPIEIDETSGELGPLPSESGRRASDKGFLCMPAAAYIELLDWTARTLVAQRRGLKVEALPPVFERLNIKPDVWHQMVTNFGKLFSLVAGRPQRVDTERGRVRGRRYYMPKATRELLTS